MLPALRRIPQVRDLIDQQTYFVVHAPRQVGKTTTLMSLAAELTREGRYTALLVSLEYGAPFRSDPGAAELAVLGPWRSDARRGSPRAAAPAVARRRCPASASTPPSRPGPARRRARSSSSSTRSTPSRTTRSSPSCASSAAVIRGPPQELPVVPRADRPARRPRLQGRRRQRRSTRHRQPLQHQGRVADAPRLHRRRGRRALSAAHRRYRPALHRGRAVGRLRRDPGPAVAGQRAGPPAHRGRRPRSQRRDHPDDVHQGPADPHRPHGHPPRQPRRSPAGAAGPPDPRPDDRRRGAARAPRGGYSLYHRSRPPAPGRERRPGRRQPDLPRGHPALARRQQPRLAAAHRADLAHPRGSPRPGPAPRRLPRVLARARRGPPRHRDLPGDRPAPRAHGLPAPRRERRRRAQPRIRGPPRPHRPGPPPRPGPRGDGAQGLARRGKDPRPQGLKQLDGYLAGLGLDSGWLIIFDQRADLPPIEDRTRSETPPARPDAESP
jgi:hypothetical protein